MSTNRFACDYARLGTSGCKKCKQKLVKGSLRLAKVTPNPFTDGEGEMKQYFHAKCLFETFAKARSTTKVIENDDDIEGFSQLQQDDQDFVNDLIKELLKTRGSPRKQPAANKRKGDEISKDHEPKPKKKKVNDAPSSNTLKKSERKSDINDSETVQQSLKTTEESKDGNDGDGGLSETKQHDNSFQEFRKLCHRISNESSHTLKTAVVAKYLRTGTNGVSFHGDVYLLLKFLLPGVVKTIYNLQDRQLVKIFTQIFGADQDKMLEHLEQGDVSATVAEFYSEGLKIKPHNKSTLSLQEVDSLLQELSTYTKEDEQLKCLTKIVKRCTVNDLKVVVRLIKHDLKINCGSKLILDGLDNKAYEAFKTSRDLKAVVEMVLKSRDSDDKIKVKANLMTPVQPMLAEACKSVEQAFKKCPNGMFAEIKYDGERVQLHKNGDQFQYFSRSLKPVLDHKVKHFKDFIPQAFPGGSSLILDSEVLLIDTKRCKPLPFGTLGVHKKAAFSEANVCLFVFDCLHYNGENLMKKPIKERRKVLKKVMVEIPNHIMFSEMTHVTEEHDLVGLMMKVFKEGLEGLVLKDVNGIYEPGMRHWLKVKKDYLAQGKMADSADLVVLGAYFGTGQKGGKKSVFLMGAYDEITGKWCTVTKCGSGLSDAALDKLQTSIVMKKISKDPNQVPSWLNVSRTLVPDFVVQDPKTSPVWEIFGTEFSKSEVHTAAGISIRFPRILKMRDDKTSEEATSVQRLMVLFEKSKEYSGIENLFSQNSLKPKNKSQKAKTASREEDKSEEENLNESTTNGGGEDEPMERSSAQENSFTIKTNQLLKDLFPGLSFCLSTDLEVPLKEKLKRYIIAYGGDIIEDDVDSGDYGDYIVSSDNKSEIENSKVIAPELIWTCIKNAEPLNALKCK